MWVRWGLTGGGVALDGIAGVSIDPTDISIVADHSGNTIYYYEVRLDSAAENSPYVIDPNDAGVTRWHLMDMYGGVISAASGFYVEGTRWDDGSGNMSETVVRTAVTPTVLDKATDTYVVSEIDATALAAVTAHTDEAAFAGTTNFATNAELTSHTTTLTGVSGEATKVQLTSHTNEAAFAGVTNFSTNAELTAHTVTLSGVSGEATKVQLTAHTDGTAFAGVTNFATNAELTAHTNDAAFAGNTNFVTGKLPRRN
jgi:hypothetical protein